MREQEFIANYLRPLCSDAAALKLQDDTALLKHPQPNMVLTTDTLVAGVHFFAQDPPELIAKKMLRVNISDLAAMGAWQPAYYLMNLTLSPDINETWLAAFCEGLKQDHDAYGIQLIGGDTTTTPGPLTLSVTCLGHAPHPLHKHTAQAGNILAIAGGTIGDAALGLQALQGTLDWAETAHFIQAYHLPDPKPELAQALAPYLTATTDISDGLIADSTAIADASGLGAHIDSATLPFSPEAQALLAEQPEWLEKMLTGGDDYQLLVTLPETQLQTATDIATSHGTSLTPIGQMQEGESVTIHDREGRPMRFNSQGYQHQIA